MFLIGCQLYLCTQYSSTIKYYQYIIYLVKKCLYSRVPLNRSSPEVSHHFGMRRHVSKLVDDVI